MQGFVLSCWCVVLLVLSCWCVVLLATTVETLELSRRVNQKWHSKDDNTNGIAALKGWKAKNTLLRRTQPLPYTNNFYRDFEKAGDYAQAMRDFNSVNPTAVDTFITKNGGKSTWGNVGDTTFIVHSKGMNGRPTLRIAKTKLLKELLPRKILDRNIDRIIYKGK